MLFEVTYKCPKGDHEDVKEVERGSWSAAMETISAPCPHHEELGDLRAISAWEIRPK